MRSQEEYDALLASAVRLRDRAKAAEARLEAALQALQAIATLRLDEDLNVERANHVARLRMQEIAREALAGVGGQEPEEVSEPDAAADKGAVTSAVAGSVRTPSGSLTSPVAQENKT